ncbi:lipase [Thermopolyspora sp. NPDC052614]|uniref:alpha/beta hydrolase n=1 Tax=Thermopolyspora sp. NPDC052614 TaxID=3155682 RepID=UPI00341AF1AF
MPLPSPSAPASPRRTGRVRGLLRAVLAAVTAATVLAVAAPPAPAATPTATAAVTADPIKLTLPEPTGPYPIGVVQAHLIDENRADPWKPDRRRELMVSIWYPARADRDKPLAPWLSPGLATVFEQLMAIPEYLAIPVGSVDWKGVKSHARIAAAPLPGRRPWPVVLFSPGQGTARALNTVQVEDLASRGNVVVTIDHTYEEAAVEFPDGRVELGLSLDRGPETQRKSNDSRVADIRFVLDQLARLRGGNRDVLGSTGLPAGLRRAFTLNSVGVFGHVQGGYAGLEAMYHDRRIDAGVNLDGVLAYGDGRGANPYLPGMAAQHDLGRPTLLMGAHMYDVTGPLVAHNHVNGSDRSWTDFWSVQSAFKRDLTLNGSALDSYADFMFFLPQINARMPLNPAIVRLFIGDVDPDAALNAQRAYLASFFDRFLKGRNDGLLDGPSPRYPQITFVN